MIFITVREGLWIGFIGLYATVVLSLSLPDVVLLGRIVTLIQQQAIDR